MRPIEKNIPLPPTEYALRTHGKRGKYPWHLMDVGDSFTTDASLSTIKTFMTYQKKKRGWQFTARQIDADTVRVWRIS